MIIRKVLATVLTLILIAGIAAAQGSEKERAAIASAKKWLVAVDNGKYAESWQEAGSFFKNAVTKEKFAHSMEVFRKPLGKVLSREVESATYKTSLPGIPDGQYVVIRFKTSFDHKASAIETVTPMFDKDGKWRVAGYFIK